MNAKEIESRLLDTAAAATGNSAGELLSQIAVVRTDRGWGEWIDDDVLACWDGLSLESRLVAVIQAATLDKYQRQDECC